VPRVAILKLFRDSKICHFWFCEKKNLKFEQKKVSFLVRIATGMSTDGWRFINSVHQPSVASALIRASNTVLLLLRRDRISSGPFSHLRNDGSRCDHSEAGAALK
jgi:hypothetical protein